jgi:hypothetical protein
MHICKNGLLPWLVCLSVLAVHAGVAETPQTARSAAAAARSQNPAVAEADDLRASIAFRFDILDLVTNHQFTGQKNSFRVEYEYAGVLKGAGFDPKGHAVPPATYPYFQSVRDAILDYIAKYPDQTDFYEVFGLNICRHVMREFPQIRKITLRIDTPAYGPVNVDRGETISLERRLPRR